MTLNVHLKADMHIANLSRKVQIAINKLQSIMLSVVKHFVTFLSVQGAI